VVVNHGKLPAPATIDPSDYLRYCRRDGIAARALLVGPVRFLYLLFCRSISIWDGGLYERIQGGVR
jgi:hypothetical protein